MAWRGWWRAGGGALLLVACATRPPTVRGPAPEPWTLDSLVYAARHRGEPAEPAPDESAGEADPGIASAPPTPWQAGFTLPTDPDRMLRPPASLAHIRAKNALVTRRLEALWAARTRIREALVDYCEARELARFRQGGEAATALQLAALGGAAFVPLAELRAGVVLCTDFMALPPPADDETLLRAALAHRTDYLAAVENYLFQKSLWHRRRGTPPRSTGATLPIAFPAFDDEEAAPATLEVALRHRLLVSEVRDYGEDYRLAYRDAATAAARGLDLARISAWYRAHRALTPLEDAARSVLTVNGGLARPW